MEKVIFVLIAGACVFALGYSVGKPNDPAAQQAEEAAKAAQLAQERTPVLVTKVEQCNVWKFTDNYATRYVTVCPSGEAQTQWREGCGKTCTRTVENPTVGK